MLLRLVIHRDVHRKPIEPPVSLLIPAYNEADVIEKKILNTLAVDYPQDKLEVVIVCDGTDAAAKRIARVLWNDPATGVMRHADAGYEIAKACAREQGLKLPMLDG